MTIANLEVKDKNDKTMDSSMLQNTADSDATYRYKSGAHHRGYATNIVEDVDKNGNVISDYNYKPRTFKDSIYVAFKTCSIKVCRIFYKNNKLTTKKLICYAKMCVSLFRALTCSNLTMNLKKYSVFLYIMVTIN